MENQYAENSFLWNWYEYWVPLAFATFVLVLGIYVWVTTEGRLYRVVLRVLAALALLGTWPMAAERIGFGTTNQEESMAVLSFLGTVGSAAVAAFHFVTSRRRRADALAAPPQAGPATAGPDTTAAIGTAVPPAAAAAPGEPAATAADGDVTLVAPGPAASAAPAPAAAAPAAWIHFRSGPNAGETMPLGGDVTSIGRGVENDIVVSDEGVSRTHAQIAFRDGRFQFTDVGSAGGTLVGGQPAAETVVLESGSTIQVGGTELVFMQGDAPAAPGAAPAQPPTAQPAAGDAAATIVSGQAQAAPAVMAWLAVTEGPSKGETRQLSEGDTVIGREDAAGLVVRDTAVSRQHARVVARAADDIILVDLGSAGGTTVNGQPVGRSLSGDSRLQLGDSVLELVTVEAGQAAPVEADSGGATIVGPPSAARGSAVLIVRNGPDAGKTFPLKPDEPNLVGRSPSADVQLTDPSVSGEHAIITVRGDAIAVHDLASSNGTRVDGQVVAPAQLKGGDVIRVGQSEIVLMTPPGA
jgi:pSer/pThr/pTyr-binding forkhead associated (FHA) protein